MSQTLYGAFELKIMPLVTRNQPEGTHRLRTHAVLLLTLTITFQPKTMSLLGYLKVIPYTKLNTLGSFVLELCCGQTDGQTKGLENTNPTPTDVVGVGILCHDGILN